MISSDLFAYDFDQHPLSPPAVKTHGSAIQLTRRIRSQVPKVLVSKAKPPSRPLMTATTRAALVLQVRVGEVVQPDHGPASSVMGMRGVMFRAFTRVNPLSIIYHSHTPDARGASGDRPRPNQPLLNPTSTAESESYCGPTRQTAIHTRKPGARR